MITWWEAKDRTRRWVRFTWKLRIVAPLARAVICPLVGHRWELVDRFQTRESCTRCWNTPSRPFTKATP